MTELRRRMLEDMRLAGLSETTQARYVRAVRRLAKAFKVSPRALDNNTCTTTNRALYLAPKSLASISAFLA